MVGIWSKGSSFVGSESDSEDSETELGVGEGEQDGGSDGEYFEGGAGDDAQEGCSSNFDNGSGVGEGRRDSGGDGDAERSRAVGGLWIHEGG